MKRKKMFSPDDLAKIEAAVRAAEAGTRGEVVPVVVERSSQYGWAADRAAFVGLAAASVVATVFHYRHPFLFELGATFLLQAAGMAFGWLAGRTRFVLKLLVSQRGLAEEVHEAAQAAFLRHGLVNTRDRTGVLIFISLFEHQVEILADQGIHAKVGDGFWRGKVEEIVAGARGGNATEALVHAISGIGEVLRAHFPAGEGDVNELGNQLRQD